MSEAHGERPERDDPFGPDGSRFAAVSRRRFLAALSGLGAAAVLGITACGHDDAEVFARGASSTAAGAGSTTTSRAGGVTTSPTTSRSSASTPSTTAAPPTTAPATPPITGPPGSLSGDMAVRFTYAPTSTRGRVNNPYVAVWVEDAGGELVDTIGLWYQQSGRGVRYLNELRRWASVDGSTTDTVSSATRTPGDYALVWKLTDSAGKAVAPGSYFICIEAAREHGPYSLIRQPFTLGAPFRADLPSEGELSNASIAQPAS